MLKVQKGIKIMGKFGEKFSQNENIICQNGQNIFKKILTEKAGNFLQFFL